jgi:hypothetical protein
MGDLGDGEDVDEVEEELGRRRLLAAAIAGPQVSGGAPGRPRLFDRGGDLAILFPYASSMRAVSGTGIVATMCGEGA